MACFASPRVRRLRFQVVSIVFALTSVAGFAQTDAAACTDDAADSVIAADLDHPRDFVWGADGALYVAEAGSADTPRARAAAAAGASVPGQGAAVVRIGNGTSTTIAGALPAGELPSLGWSFLEWHVAALDGRVYALQAAGGADRDQVAYAALLYAIDADGHLRPLADLAAWMNPRPLPPLPTGPAPDGRPRFALASAGGALWIADSVNAQVLRVDPAGTLVRYDEPWPEGSAPAGLAAAPDGGLYIGLAAANGDSGRVEALALDGTAAAVWTGLPSLAGIAVGPDGALYAAVPDDGGQGDGPCGGAILRRTGAASAIPVVAGLHAPAAVGFGPDGALYATGPAGNADDARGTLLRLEPGGSAAPPHEPPLRARRPVAVRND